MRYGNQPLSEIERWPLTKFRWVLDTLAEMIAAENPDPEE